MKLFLLSLLMVCGIAVHGVEQKKTVWLHDVGNAQEQAKKEEKHVLLYFTGSDWSQLCINYRREVLSKLDFIKYARRNLILAEIDFPLKSAQTEEQRSANEALKAKYHPKGLPAIIVLNKDGAEVWRQEGAPGGGVRVLLEALTGAIGDK